MGMVDVTVVQGDLLDQRVDVIVNAWNRNIIPWWLLLPQGVSGAIKKRGGIGPFRELAKHGPMPLGSAVMTGPGKLPYRAIIHVAGISMLWMSSEQAIRDCVRNALRVAMDAGFESIAFPTIGAGTGGVGREKALGFILEEIERSGTKLRVLVVEYKPSKK